MGYSNDELQAATNAGIITPGQRDALLAFLGARTASPADASKAAIAARGVSLRM